MIEHANIDDTTLRRMIRYKEITVAGNLKLKIYGSLHCGSGKRMKRITRVFFTDETEALQKGFRACKRCMKPIAHAVK